MGYYEEPLSGIVERLSGEENSMARPRARQFPLLIEALKAQLKAQGLRQSDVAERLGVGLATVKRWLAGDALTTQRLEDLCDLAKISLIELIEAAAREPADKIAAFSPSQERALAEDPQLFFVFFSLLNGWPREDCERELALPSGRMDTLLKRLARLGLIDILPGGRVRLLTVREVAWRRDGPLSKNFAARRDFVERGGGTDLHMSDFVKLSAAGLNEIRDLLEEMRREIHRIARADRHRAATDRRWQGLLFVAHPLDMDAIRATMSGKAADKR